MTTFPSFNALESQREEIWLVHKILFKNCLQLFGMNKGY